MSEAIKLNRYLVMTYHETWGETPHYVWALDAQEAVNKTKETYSDEEISALFTEYSISICKAFKEIPGLPDGNYDKNAIFRELVKK